MKNSHNLTIIHEDKKKISSSAILGRKGLLVIMSANAFGTALIIGKNRVVIGRHDECDLYLDDPLISREHFAVTADNEGNFYVEDLSSSNGTYLNSKKLKKKEPLVYSDRISAGNTIVRFLMEEELEKK